MVREKSKPHYVVETTIQFSQENFFQLIENKDYDLW